MTTKREETGKHDPKDCPPNCSLPYGANNCVYAVYQVEGKCTYCGFNPEEMERRRQIPLTAGPDGKRYIHLPHIPLPKDAVADAILEETGENKPMSATKAAAKPKKKPAPAEAEKKPAAKAKPAAKPKVKTAAEKKSEAESAAQVAVAS